MLKKSLILFAWLIGFIILAACCWAVGLWRRWPLWQSAALFAAIVAALLSLRWLHRRWRAWRLRRQLSRPVGNDTFSTKRLDMDWRAGLNALKSSRLSRFGSPLYVLPWYLALGSSPSDATRLLQHAAGTEPVHGRGEDPAVLHWWLLRHAVVLSPSDALDKQTAPSPVASAYWRRLLYFMMHTRRREPLNGLVLIFDTEWLMQSDEAQLRGKGQDLRKQLDELTRIYNARIPVYVVLAGAENLPGFAAWAQSLGNELNRQAMGYLNKTPHATVGQFISDGFNSIVHRMFDLRILSGIEDAPDEAAFGLPERMVPLADRLGIVLRPAFQATPYAETPLLRGLYVTGQPSRADASQPAWFSEGLFEHALPAQRHAWQPLERWRHWRRLMRHAAVLCWLLTCLGIGALLLYASRITQQHLQALNHPSLDATRDFSGPVSSDLYALQSLREAIHSLETPTHWSHRWLPFHHRVEAVRQALINTYTQDFHREIVVANLDPLLSSSLPLAENTKNDQLLAAWVQMLVRRINLIDTALQGQDVYAQPAPGSEIPMLFSQAKGPRPSLVDGVILGNMYQDYLTWQPNRQMLVSERQALAQALINLNLGNRPLTWINAWVDLQGDIPPVRLTDFWNIPSHPDQPYVPAAFTPAGEQAVAGFVKELERATNNNALWQQRQEELRAQHLQTGLNTWYEFSDAFAAVPRQLADGTLRRAVLSSLFTSNDPYGRLLHLLAQVGDSIPEASRPHWLRQAIQLDGLWRLVQSHHSPQAGMAAKLQQRVNVVQQFGGNLLQRLPHGEALTSDLSELHTDQQAVDLLQAYRKGILSTTALLQQGQGAALKAASDIWSFGRDPSITSVALIDASNALARLRKHVAQADDARSNVVWRLLSGPMDFTLDYAGRSAACSLQQTWDSNVLSVAHDVQSSALADDLLFGDRGQVPAFLNGQIKHFIERIGNRYQGSQALGQTIPLNGQFYAFASMTQLRQVTLAGDALKSKQDQSQTQALTQQQSDLDQQIAKLQATTANVTLTTMPTQTNSDAHRLPESVTLSLQCANGRLTLENLNFPNQTVFPWSLSQCGDTILTIQYADFALTRQWSGARGFIEFLREFSSGKRKYTPADFNAQAVKLQHAGVRWITIGYTQRGQTALLSAFADADKLVAKSDAVRNQLAQLQHGATTATHATPGPSPQAVPSRIITTCMEPVARLPRTGINHNVAESPEQRTPTAVAPVPASHSSSKTTVERPPSHRKSPAAVPPPQRPSAKPSSKPYRYAVQVGIFADADSVRGQLALHGYETEMTMISLNNRAYQRIQVVGYTTEATARAAAQHIAQLLRLTPEVIRQPD